LQDILIRPYQDADRPQIIQLWRTCELIVPQNDPNLDIDRKLRVNPELFLVAMQDDVVSGSIMAGYEGHRGWLNYLAVAPGKRRLGLGRLLVEAAAVKLQHLGCPKINLQVRLTNNAVIAFYQHLGFVEDKVLSMGKRLAIDPLPESPTDSGEKDHIL